MKEKAEALFNGHSYTLADVQTRALRKTQLDLNAAPLFDTNTLAEMEALAEAMGTTLKDMEIKRLIGTLFKVKIEEVAYTMADTLVLVVPQTLTKHLSKWKPKHKTRL